MTKTTGSALVTKELLFWHMAFELLYQILHIQIQTYICNEYI